MIKKEKEKLGKRIGNSAGISMSFRVNKNRKAVSVLKARVFSRDVFLSVTESDFLTGTKKLFKSLNRIIKKNKKARFRSLDYLLQESSYEKKTDY